jgi:hypothetical protein
MESIKASQNLQEDTMIVRNIRVDIILKGAPMLGGYSVIPRAVRRQIKRVHHQCINVPPVRMIIAAIAGPRAIVGSSGRAFDRPTKESKGLRTFLNAKP